MTDDENYLFEKMYDRSKKYKKSIQLNSVQSRLKALFEESCGALEALNCFVCNNNSFSNISLCDRYGFYYPTGLCTCCGNLQQTHYYEEQDLINFYTNFYRQIYDGRSPAELARFQYTTSGTKIYKFLLENHINQGSVLEVGCGAGGILQFLKSKSFKVLGTDFDDTYLTHARSQDIPVRLGGLEQIPSHQKFNIIILNHVLEHIVNPVDFLKSISKYLTSGGKLLVEVPTLESLYRGAYGHDFMGFFQNAHTCHYSKESLRAILMSAGLKTVSQADENLYMFECAKQAGETSILDFAKLKKSQIDLLVGIEQKRISINAFLTRFLTKCYLRIYSAAKKAGLLTVLKKNQKK